MRIALCLSRQPRYVKENYNATVLSRLIKPNDITDVFIHTWWRPEWEQGHSYSGVNRPQYYFKLDDLTDIVSLYKPKKILIENDLDYREFITENYTKNDSFISRIKSNILNVYAIHLSIYKSNQLKNEYEKEHGFEYDAVINMRFDTCIRHIPVIIKDLDLSKLNLPTYASRPCIEEEVFPTSDWGVNDQFAIGNKKNMDMYCDVVNNIFEIAKYKPAAMGEEFVGTHLKMNNVRIYKPWHGTDGDPNFQITFWKNWETINFQ
jgi:hypothetical protein